MADKKDDCSAQMPANAAYAAQWHRDQLPPKRKTSASSGRTYSGCEGSILGVMVQFPKKSKPNRSAFTMSCFWSLQPVL
jgi:hypothetical protein